MSLAQSPHNPHLSRCLREQPDKSLQRFVDCCYSWSTIEVWSQELEDNGLIETWSLVARPPF